MKTWFVSRGPVAQPRRLVPAWLRQGTGFGIYWIYNLKNLLVRYSYNIAEVTKASDIVMHIMISAPKGVGSNPAQGGIHFLAFSNILNIFKLTFHF